MRSLLVWGCFGSAFLGGCALVSGLNGLDVAGDAGVVDALGSPDSPLPGKDAGVDSSGGPDANPLDTGGDAPKDVGGDVGCSATCPPNTTCNGSFCAIPQGPACGAGASFNGASGAVDGTVCTSSSGPKVQTTCASPINSPATFIKFTSGGDPWLVDVTAGNGPIQVQVMDSTCATPGACIALAPGASTTVTANQNSVVAIVSVGGCSDWKATYQSK